MISGIETIPAKGIEESRVLFNEKVSEGKELPPTEEVANSNGGLAIEKPDIAYIERTTRITLIEQNNIVEKEAVQRNNEGAVTPETKINEGLTDEEKAKIKEETGWSDEIIENIQSMKQYEILKNAGLKEIEINGRKCLIKENIDLDYKDDDGISNRDRIARGLAPLDSKTGKPIELHHLGQKADSPLVELTEEEHRTGISEDGTKNQSIWHDNTKETEVHGVGNTWSEERKSHWKARSSQIEGGNS
jgi:hypothetical protein